MSEAVGKPERRFLLWDSYAINSEYHEAGGRFVFQAADGTTVTISCAGDPAEKTQAFIVDVQKFVPVARMP